MRIAVLGAGAWGTALAIAFADRNNVSLWAREPEVVAAMHKDHENTRFLPGHRLPDNLKIEGDFAAALTAAELLVVATPLAGLRPTLKQIARLAPKKPLVWVCKGLEAGTAKLPHMLAEEVLPAGTFYGALSGPSFAEEVAIGKPTAIALAGNNENFANETAIALHTPRLRIYANNDLTGVEIGGAVKNVMAIATGICDGMMLGLNARAALITRGLAEISRLGLALGAQRETLMGLAGIGDLLLTCTGDLSRNRRVGLALATGMTLPQILEDLGHVAEGVSTAREVVKLSQQLSIEMPITEAVDAILHHGVSAVNAVEQLLLRDPKPETA